MRATEKILAQPTYRISEFWGIPLLIRPRTFQHLLNNFRKWCTYTINQIKIKANFNILIKKYWKHLFQVKFWIKLNSFLYSWNWSRLKSLQFIFLHFNKFAKNMYKVLIVRVWGWYANMANRQKLSSYLNIQK